MDVRILEEGFIPPDRQYLKLFGGGPGSGNFGHAGRDAENKRGGSLPKDDKGSIDSEDDFEDEDDSDEEDGETVNSKNIARGDLVDFGAYGELYIVADHGDKWWVTDQVEDRFNPDARGWYINKSFAEKVLEKGSAGRDDNPIAKMKLNGQKFFPKFNGTEKDFLAGQTNSGKLTDIDDLFDEDLTAWSGNKVKPEERGEYMTEWVDTMRDQWEGNPETEGVEFPENKFKEFWKKVTGW